MDLYLMGVALRNMLIGFGPEVYLAMTSGIIIFTKNIIVCIIIMLSFETPASMSFKIDTLSVAANPIFNINILFTLIGYD